MVKIEGERELEFKDEQKVRYTGYIHLLRGAVLTIDGEGKWDAGVGKFFYNTRTSRDLPCPVWEDELKHLT